MPAGKDKKSLGIVLGKRLSQKLLIFRECCLDCLPIQFSYLPNT
jgi:hypothetical protein